MKLMLPLIALCVLVGLTASTLDRKVYLRMLVGIVAISLYYYLTWLF